MTSPAHQARLDTLAGRADPFHGLLRTDEATRIQPPRPEADQRDKRCASLMAAFDALQIEDGATLSFHHHYRNGDRLMNAVFDCAARRGLRRLTLAASSLFDVHAPLARHIETGVIARVITDYARGPLADAMLSDALSQPAVLQSHGGRARALTTGALRVDAAFVGAPLARPDGTATGRGGRLACGPLGYAMVDAAHARATVICADEITTDPLSHVDIPASHVDLVVPFGPPGSPEGIAGGTTLPAQTRTARRIGALVCDVIAAAGALRNGMSLQTGAGGYSLGAVPLLGRRMADAGVTGGNLCGGITGAHVALLEAGVFRHIRDVQCFDTAAVASAIRNPDHRAMDASAYANPLHPRPAVTDLTVMLLGAAEIDRHFNVNVTTLGDGRLRGGPGGHPDAAEGAALSIVTTALTAGGYAKLVEDVRCVTTPGASIDVLITEAGIAVTPARPDLSRALTRAGLPVMRFEALQAMADGIATQPRTLASHPTPRLLIENRRGGLGDWM